MVVESKMQVFVKGFGSSEAFFTYTNFSFYMIRIAETSGFKKIIYLSAQVNK